MTNPLISFLAWCLLGSASCGIAQTPLTDETIPPQKSPAVAKPRPGTAWEITLQYSDDKKGVSSASSQATQSSVRVSSLRYEQDQEFTFVRATRSDGTQSVGYVHANQVLARYANTGQVYTRPTDDGNYLYPYFVTGYPGTAWVTLNEYRGVEKIGTTLCYKFVRPSAPAPDPINGDSPLPELAVWVKVEDQIPLRATMGNITYSFSSVGPLGAHVNPPADIKQFLDKLSGEESALNFMRQH